MKPMGSNAQKNLQWKAHEGVVLKVDWSPTNNCIVSCGEDCKYKVWDSLGRLLFSSSPAEHVITSISWTPNGDYFAVSSYGALRLCDRTGWTHSLHKVDEGSLMKIAWSVDSTMVVGACAAGDVLFS